MFETNEDVDIDDDFLIGAFDSEQEHLNRAHSSIIEDQSSSNTHQPQSRFLISHVKEKSSGCMAIDGLLTHRDVMQSQGNDCNTEMRYGNKENKRKQVSSSVSSRLKRERKFPGPAGLLPDRKSNRGTPVKLDSLLEPDKSPPHSLPDELCSQGRCSGSILDEEPWQSFLSDLGPDKRIIDVVNVASVKRKAAARCFVGRKVPFLAAVLHHLDVSSPDPCIILRDSTGEIHGTLHREVWEQFAGELVVGSVLVVRNVGLLSTGMSTRRHYLNITANNLATIYSANPDKMQKTKLYPFTTQDFVQTIENWRTLLTPSHVVGSPGHVSSPALFNSSLCSFTNKNPEQSPRNTNINNSICKRAQINQKVINAAQGSNIRSETAVGVRPNNSVFAPGNSPFHRPLSKVNGKNLLPLFSPDTYKDFSNAGVNTSNLPPHNRHFDKLKIDSSFQNSFLSPTTTRPNSSQRGISYNMDCVISSQNPKAGSNSFKFDPVIIKPKKLSSEVFHHINSERKSGIIQNTIPSSLSESILDSGNNNTKIILSQSSQLTAEEQSLVESVFDGIDADSLFDDDF